MTDFERKVSESAIAAQPMQTQLQLANKIAASIKASADEVQKTLKILEAQNMITLLPDTTGEFGRHELGASPKGVRVRYVKSTHWKD
jgi:hypothetical protein